MAIKILEACIELKLEFIDIHLVLENNVKMRAECERIGGQVIKKFRIYRKIFKRKITGNPLFSCAVVLLVVPLFKQILHIKVYFPLVGNRHLSKWQMEHVRIWPEFRSNRQTFPPVLSEALNNFVPG